MRLCALCIALLFFSLFLKAQIITTGLNELNAFTISFNPDFVKKSKIKSITKQISNKADNEMIVDKGLTEYYEFDTQGFVKYSFVTAVKAINTNNEVEGTPTKKGTRPYFKTEYNYLYDTVFTFNTYDDKHRLIIKRNSIIGREVFRSHYYEYDSLGNIKRETVIREVNDAENIRDFKAGMQTVLSSESFLYEKNAKGQLKKKFLNDEGRVYKEGMIYFDEKGNPTEESFAFVVTWIKERNTYKYNSKGWLIEKKLTSNDGYLSHEACEYDFNEKDMISGMHLFKSGIKTKDISYIYNKDTKFLESEVSRNYKTASIDIVKYIYQQYE